MNANGRNNSDSAFVCRCLRYFAVLIVGLSCIGCVSGYARRLTDIRRDYYDLRDVELAKKDIETLQKRAPQKEQDVLSLNQACLELYSGDAASAKKELAQARDSFDSIEQKRIQQSAESLISYWTDDNFNSYEGEDYEKVLVRAMLAIADLFDGGEDARAYAYQIAAKQDEIVQNGFIDDPMHEGKKVNPKRNYPRVPLGPYLEGLLWEETYLLCLCLCRARSAQRTSIRRSDPIRPFICRSHLFGDEPVFGSPDNCARPNSSALC